MLVYLVILKGLIANPIENKCGQCNKMNGLC